MSYKRIIRDMDLPNEFEQLYKKKVYLYGAGLYGKKTCQMLNEIGVFPEGFVDAKEDIQGIQVFGIPVFSPTEIYLLAEKEDIIVIVSTEKYTDEIIDIMEEKKFNCKSVYTLFGLKYAIYFNLDKLDEQIRSKYRDRFSIWRYNRELEVYRNQANQSLEAVINGEAEIVVFQPGKVGSNTVAATLRHYGVPVVHSHGILFSSEYANGGQEVKNTLTKYLLNSGKKIKLITLVRDPIAKDIGHFFQKISETANDVGWLVKGLMEKDFQKSFLNYLSVVTPFDFSTEQKKLLFNEKMICHIDYIGTKSEKGALWGWYEEELKNTLGINVLADEFDTEKGYSVFKYGNIELLIMQLEKLNQLEEVLAEFVGVENLKLVNVNRGAEKAYRYVYKQFQQQVQLPRKYVEFCYNNPYMNHFYSKADRKKFYSKWERHIVD